MISLAGGIAGIIARRACSRRPSNTSRRSIRSCRRCPSSWRSACRSRSDSCSASCRRRARPSRIRSLSPLRVIRAASGSQLPSPMRLSTLVSPRRARALDGRACPGHAARRRQAAHAAATRSRWAQQRGDQPRRCARSIARLRAVPQRRVQRAPAAAALPERQRGEPEPRHQSDHRARRIDAFVGQSQNQSTHAGSGSARRFRSRAARSRSARRSAASTNSARADNKLWQTSPVVVQLQQDLFKPRDDRVGRARPVARARASPSGRISRRARTSPAASPTRSSTSIRSR